MKRLDKKVRHEHMMQISHFRDNYGFRFFHSSFDAVPFVSKYIPHEKIKSNLEGIENYLLGTYPIFVGTNDDSKIREIQHNMPDADREWYERHSKLRTNRWGTLGGLQLYTLNSMLGREDLLSPTFESHYKNYEGFSFIEKIKFVRSMDHELYCILEKVAEEHL